MVSFWIIFDRFVHEIERKFIMEKHTQRERERKRERERDWFVFMELLLTFL
jgi:hypothetical protein